MSLRKNTDLLDSTGEAAVSTHELLDLNAVDATASQEPLRSPTRSKKGGRFWAVLVALLLTTFFAVLEAYSVSTALPVIVSDLRADQFVWVASAYGIASTALLPLSGGLADMFGRLPVMLGSVAVFGLGGALAGGAQSMNMLIAARVVQGVGAGGTITLSQITLSDMVTLEERGTYNGLIGLTWSLSGCLGPIVGGSLAHHTQWRWIFYMTIPACVVVAVIFLVSYRPNKPDALSRQEIIVRLDVIGNILLVGSTCSMVIGLTWGGINFPWVSPQVLVPLCVGVAGLAAFVVYEWSFCPQPIVPLRLLLNRTSMSGYIQIGLSAYVNIVLLYYLPVYFQACQAASPLASGVDLFGLVFTTGPCSILVGVSIVLSKRYRPQLWFAWCMIIVGVGLCSTISASTSRIAAICFQIPAGVGIGIIFSAAYFPVLAPLPTTSNAAALSFFVFIRTFAQIWGVTIGGALLQNELQNRIPADIQAMFPGNNNIAYTVVPVIAFLPNDEDRVAVREAFARSLVTVWRMLIVVAGVGFLTSLPMRGLPLHTQKDARFALREDQEEMSENR